MRFDLCAFREDYQGGLESLAELQRSLEAAKREHLQLGYMVTKSSRYSPFSQQS